MPSFNILKELPINHKSFRCNYVCNTFDITDDKTTEHFVGNIDMPDEWNVGLIVGNSGTGKTTISKQLFGENIVNEYEWSNDNILDDFDKCLTVNEITSALSSVGLSSVPLWLKPYNVLSNGQKMRATLARAICENNDLIVFDEFTSVVDRNVAKSISHSIQKSIRRSKKKFIAISCHHDVKEWLLPDWIFDTDTMEYTLCPKKKYIPSTKLECYEIKSTERKLLFWRMFGKYHYLNHNFNIASRVFIFCLNETACCFLSTLPLPNGNLKNRHRIHRLVVLPDYQGLGIAKCALNFIGNLFTKQNKKLRIKTGLRTFAKSLYYNENFKLVAKGVDKFSYSKKSKINKSAKNTSGGRFTYCFEYKN